jgi:hypothetical protein
MGPTNGSLRTRLWAAAIVAGVVAIAVLVVLVFKFGRYNPSPPSLVEHPNPAIPGEILYIDRQGCISRAAASGATRSQVYCPGAGASAITWVDRKTIAFTEFKSFAPPTWTKVDLESKQTTDTGISARLAGPNPVSPKGERVILEANGDVTIVDQDLRRVIAHFDIPAHRIPVLATWSPDGEWLLLAYWSQRGNAQELWVVSRDGNTKGTLADAQAMGPFAVSWWIDGSGYLPEASELPQAR